MFTIVKFIAIGYFFMHIISLVSKEFKKEKEREKKLNNGWTDYRTCN